MREHGRDFRNEARAAELGRQGAQRGIGWGRWRWPFALRRFLERRVLRIERKRGAAPGAEGLQRGRPLRAPSFPAQLADQELHPVPLLVLAVAEPVKHAEDRLRHVEDLACGKKVVERLTGGAQD